MSLAVPADLLEQAHRGEVDDAAFLDCVRSSLPYAWGVISGLIADLDAGEAEFADNQVPPPDETARGQLRLLRHLGLVEGTRRGKTTVYALYDDHVARLLDEAVYHSEHLRLGLRDAAAGRQPALAAAPG